MMICGLIMLIVSPILVVIWFVIDAREKRQLKELHERLFGPCFNCGKYEVDKEMTCSKKDNCERLKDKGK